MFRYIGITFSILFSLFWLAIHPAWRTHCWIREKSRSKLVSIMIVDIPIQTVPELSMPSGKSNIQVAVQILGLPEGTDHHVPLFYLHSIPMLPIGNMFHVSSPCFFWLSPLYPHESFLIHTNSWKSVEQIRGLASRLGLRVRPSHPDRHLRPMGYRSVHQWISMDICIYIYGNWRRTDI